jgi:hypothetical protein
MRVRWPFSRPNRTLCFFSSQLWAFFWKSWVTFGKSRCQFCSVVSKISDFGVGSSSRRGPIISIQGWADSARVCLFFTPLLAVVGLFFAPLFAVIARARVWETWGVWWNIAVAGGHTAPNTPDLFRTPKLTVAGPGQYWTGGPSGNTLGCRQLFCALGYIHVLGPLQLRCFPIRTI